MRKPVPPPRRDWTDWNTVEPVLAAILAVTGEQTTVRDFVGISAAILAQANSTMAEEADRCGGAPLEVILQAAEPAALLVGELLRSLPPRERCAVLMAAVSNVYRQITAEQDAAAAGRLVQ